MSAFALAIGTRVDANIFFSRTAGRMSVKDYRVDGDLITVTLRDGGEASFDKALVVARINADEMPVSRAEPAVRARAGAPA